MKYLILNLLMGGFLFAGATATEFHTLSVDWAHNYLANVLEAKAHNVHPEKGVVPDQETAIAIAVAVWNPIYGKANIEKQVPFQIFLVNGHWVVSGSLPNKMRGGTAKIVIAKKNGTIVNVSHGR